MRSDAAGGLGALRSVKPKEMRLLYQEAVSNGAVAQVTGSGHLRLSLNGQVFFGSRSASDVRAIKNAHSTLRKMGMVK